MTILKAVVRDGRIETDEPIALPDGTELHITASRLSFRRGRLGR